MTNAVALIERLIDQLDLRVSWEESCDSESSVMKLLHEARAYLYEPELQEQQDREHF